MGWSLELYLLRAEPGLERCSPSMPQELPPNSIAAWNITKDKSTGVVISDGTIVKSAERASVCHLAL